MSTAKGLLAALCGAALVALGARSSFALPGIDLPQTGQTLAVLLVGAALGARWGGLAVVFYVLVGALGLPVFADGKAGLDTVLGPSLGYLLGFVAAAVVVGVEADRDRLRAPWWRAVVVMLLAHLVLLMFGGGVLAVKVGLAAAWSGGVAPFLPGAVVKSALAAAVVRAVGDHWPVRDGKDRSG